MHESEWAERRDPGFDPHVKAALFDIDGTLTTGGDVWRPLLDSQSLSTQKRMFLYSTMMPQYLLSKGGILSQARFRDRWVQRMAWLMAGWSADAVDQMYHEIVTSRLVPRLRSDVAALLLKHRQQGHYTVLVSTMFEGIVQAFARFLGADAGLGSVVAMENGHCLGGIVGVTCSGERKLVFARGHLARTSMPIQLGDCAAYADSQADIPMLSGVGYPVAVYPDDVMRDHAQAKGWEVFE